MTPAVEAGLCVLALNICKRLGLARGVSAQDAIQRVGVARSYAYECAEKITALLEHGLDAAPPAVSSERMKDIAICVLEHRVTHPGCWIEGGRTVYSDDVRALVLSLAEQHEDVEQADFAAACRIPLPTFKAWWAQAHQPVASPTNAAAAAPTPTSEPAAAAPPPPTATPGFSVEMLRIIAAYERWEGSLPAFVEHLRADLHLHWGREQVTQLLHLAAVRQLLRRPPPKPLARGSTFRPPPGVQWTSDGKEVQVVVDGRTFVVAWQPMLDIGSTATVGAAVRAEEDAAGVIAAFQEGVATTGVPPHVLLLDNKAPNKSVTLREALPAETLLMHASCGRPQNKATIEGSFGLFAMTLGPLVAVIDTATPERIALAVAEAVTRAYATGRNHHPRRRDGKTPCELYRDGDHSPAQIAAAVEIIRAMKDRIDQRAAREAAGRDPRVLATLEDACTRFGFVDDGDVLASMRVWSLEAVQTAVAIFAAKRGAGSIPVGADNLRYFAGIARNCQHERELLLFEEELVALLERTGQLVNTHLERRAASFAALELAPHLRAIVDEMLAVPAPVAQVFWRRALAAMAATVPSALRAALRRWLCKRIRTCYAATKQLRLALLDRVIRLLTPDPTATATAPP